MSASALATFLNRFEGHLEHKLRGGADPVALAILRQQAVAPGPVVSVARAPPDRQWYGALPAPRVVSLSRQRARSICSLYLRLPSFSASLSEMLPARYCLSVWSSSSSTVIPAACARCASLRSWTAANATTKLRDARQFPALS